PDTGHYELVELALPRGTFIYGGVRDAESGRRLPDATVQLQPVDQLLSLDEKAAFRQNLDFGTYEISGSLAGYADQQKTFTLSEEHLERGLKVVLELTPRKEPTQGCVIVTVVDAESGDVIPGARVEIGTKAEPGLRTLRANKRGKVRACLDPGQYELSASSQGYFFAVQPLTIEAKEADDFAEIALKPLVENGEIVLRNIYFDVAKSTLRDSSVAELERVHRIMQDNPGLIVEIAGHTDSDATEAYNQRLSEARAAAVVEFLIMRDIDPDRMQSHGYGELQPIAPNDTPENKQLNRRTAFKVLSLGNVPAGREGRVGARTRGMD
ncbi:MAG: OmpA family protein, partial [Bacteroidota bacterium]